MSKVIIASNVWTMNVSDNPYKSKKGNNDQALMLWLNEKNNVIKKYKIDGVYYENGKFCFVDNHKNKIVCDYGLKDPQLHDTFFHTINQHVRILTNNPVTTNKQFVAEPMVIE